ncbi:MAG: hypothetical protein ABH805_00430 [Candidatus Nealsonbacteria bacterium]
MLTLKEQNVLLREALKSDIVENHLHDFHRKILLNDNTNDIKSQIGRLSKKTGISKEKILEFYQSFLEELFQEPLDKVRSKMGSITFNKS